MIDFVGDKYSRLRLETVDRLLRESARVNRFTNGGPCVERLERVVRDLLEIGPSRAVIATCSGTAALQAAVAAIRAVRGPTSFATQAFTFPSSAVQALAYAVVVDVDEGGGLDLDALPADVGGIIVTNCFGHLVDLARYEAWRAATGKVLVYDDAATPASFWEGRNALELGDAAVVSLHHTKPLGFGEGGLIVLDRAYEVAARRLINFGFGGEPGEDVWSPSGSNGKLSEPAAAFLIAHLERFDELRATHEALRADFHAAIEGLPRVRPFPDQSERALASCLPVLFDRPATCDEFLQAGVSARKYYRPLRPLPRATDLYERIVCLPLHGGLTGKDVDRYARIARFVQDRIRGEPCGTDRRQRTAPAVSDGSPPTSQHERAR